MASFYSKCCVAYMYLKNALRSSELESTNNHSSSTVSFQVIERLKDLANRTVAMLNLRYREDLICTHHKNCDAEKGFLVLNTIVWGPRGIQLLFPTIPHSNSFSLQSQTLQHANKNAHSIQHAWFRQEIVNATQDTRLWIVFACVSINSLSTKLNSNGWLKSSANWET